MALGMILENGWPECDLSDTERLTIPGTPLSLPIRAGQPHAIMQAFFRDVDAFIEPANNSRGYTDEGSWTENNSVYTSNHKGATAVDWNWDDHPFHVKDGGWGGSILIAGSQIPAMRDLLAWYEGMIFWGNDWSNPVDSMHFQMGYNTAGPANFARVESFINRKIRADGYSTYRRGGVPRGGGTAVQPEAPANPIQTQHGLTAEVLWNIAGRPARMPLARYAELLPVFVQMLHDMDANTIDRRAMVIAQLFHESGALFYKREIASGEAYEGRADLGNTQPGDGARFRGRGWIQLTGRAHAAGFSRWMFSRDRAPTATYFVDHPEQMESDDNAAQVAVYYWTVSRPNLNALSDARNLEGATRAINGGTNGLADRKMFYDRALAVNADLLDGTATAPDPWEELLTMKIQSASIYATVGEGPIDAAIMLAGIDAHGPHEPYVEGLARQGDIDSIRRIARTAAGQGARTDAVAISQATRVLNEIYATNPAFIVAAKQ